MISINRPWHRARPRANMGSGYLPGTVGRALVTGSVRSMAELLEKSSLPLSKPHFSSEPPGLTLAPHPVLPATQLSTFSQLCAGASSHLAPSSPRVGAASN